jgi:hypothetical protein
VYPDEPPYSRSTLDALHHELRTDLAQTKDRHASAGLTHEKVPLDAGFTLG